MAPKGADGWRPASGGVTRGSVKIKGRRGIVFSPHVEAYAGERTTGKSTAVEIGAGGRASRAAAESSIGRKGTGEGG
jgi:hypothetical protein